MPVNIDAAKAAFSEGLLLSAEIRPCGEDFYVLIMLDKVSDEVPLSFWRQSQIKKYKKITGAIGDATRIGFERIVLNLAINDEAPKQAQLKLLG